VIQKSPAFQFYPNDFLGSPKVAMMDTFEVGVYWLLLCLEWQETGFAFDPFDLARWCRTSEKKFIAAWHMVGRCFVERDGRFYNERLDRERAKQKKWRDKSSDAGRRGAEKRWGKDNQPHPDPITTPTDISSSPSPIPSPTPVKASSAQASPDAARSTWLTPAAEAWEKRNGKGTFPFGQAAALFKSLKHAGHTPETIARHLGWYLEMRGDERGHNKPPEQRGPSNWAPNLKSFRDTFAKWNPEASD
jgi:uncharacterized protein YdaU (DUF1376 family)